MWFLISHLCLLLCFVCFAGCFQHCVRFHTCTCCNCSSYSGEKNDIWLVHNDQDLAILFRNPTWLLMNPSPSLHFPLLQLSIYQNFLVEQYEAKVCIHQLSAFVEQQSCLTLNSCILNLLANKPLLFLLRWKWHSNLLTYLAQVFAGVLALITSTLYFLAAAFAYKTIKDNMWIQSIFTNIYVQALKLYIFGHCYCYLCVIVKRCHL